MSNNDWVKHCTIFEFLGGSHAYGLNTETSDEDIRGICIPPEKYWLGLTRFDQADKFQNEDKVIYNIKKFVELAADCNPNIIEFLYCDESSIIKSSPWYERLREHRDWFLSSKARFTFSGYAFAQLKRIKSHKKWLMDPPKEKPLREDFGLPKGRKVGPEMLGAADTLTEDGYEFSREIMSIFTKEKQYQAEKKKWDSYQNWLQNRNLKRMNLEAEYGYDTKHAMHLVRLMSMAVEILRDGQVIVKRPDRDFLLGIRNGDWTYDRLIEWCEKQEELMDDLYKTTSLQKKPQMKNIEQLLISIIRDYFEYDMEN